VTTDEERAEIEREITALADFAGIDHAEMTYDRAYIEALKNLGGTDKDNPHGVRLRELAAEIDRRDYEEFQEEEAERDEEREASKRRAKKTAQKTRDSWKIVMCLSYPHLGFIAGDVVNAKAVAPADIKTWDIIALWKPGERATTGRAVRVTADSITLRFLRGDEETHALSELEFIGRVDPEPVEHDPDFELSEAECGRVAKLEKQIERLGQEDDQILRCTARYKLEKEIYDIRHPIVRSIPDDDLGDWSAWEEKEEAAA
jgi:hypothetical protein